MFLLIESILRGGISSLSCDRYKKSDENKKIIYVNATNLYGQSMSQVLPHDESEMWDGHPDFYMKKLEEFLKHQMIKILVTSLKLIYYILLI